MLQKVKKMRKELALNRKELILNDRHISPNEKALDLVANLTRDQIENLFLNAADMKRFFGFNPVASTMIFHSSVLRQLSSYKNPDQNRS
jgi:hypothetical protein